MQVQRRRRIPAEERRSAIIAAAAQVFAANGYERATTREIARVAEVAEGTLYRHFAGKRELLTAVMQLTLLDSITTYLTKTMETDDEAILQALLRDRFEVISNNRDLLKVIISQAFFDTKLADQLGKQVFLPAVSIISEYLNRRIKDGTFCPMPLEVPVCAIMGTVFSQIMFITMFPQKVQSDSEREELIHHLTRLILDGIRKKEVTA